MPQYLVAIHPPDDFEPSSVGKAMEHDIDVLNEEMEAKGVRLFAGGLRPPYHRTAYLDTKEHVWRSFDTPSR